MTGPSASKPLPSVGYRLKPLMEVSALSRDRRLREMSSLIMEVALLRNLLSCHSFSETPCLLFLYRIKLKPLGIWSTSPFTDTFALPRLDHSLFISWSFPRSSLIQHTRTYLFFSSVHRPFLLCPSETTCLSRYNYSLAVAFLWVFTTLTLNLEDSQLCSCWDSWEGLLPLLGWPLLVFLHRWTCL